uniref:Uncharacterized protein n=1 Tax=Timema bartmani TaxID=61472 RepID=A0A7R9F9L7_9NEOP|nr:unnamed protein product [Timema bartmani]
MEVEWKTILEKPSPVHPTEIRTLISPSSAVELNTTSDDDFSQLRHRGGSIVVVFFLVLLRNDKAKTRGSSSAVNCASGGTIDPGLPCEQFLVTPKTEHLPLEEAMI